MKTRSKLIEQKCALGIALLLGAAACGKPFRAATPTGFVDLGDHYDSRESRAATADGVVIGVRKFENDPKGTLTFWSRALENRMREMGGYALIDKHAVKDAARDEGVQMRFGHDEGTEPHLYYVTLFVTNDSIFVLEAGGTKTEMEREAKQIDWSIENFYPK